MDAGYPAMLGEDVVQGVRDREGREGLVELPDVFVTGTKVRIAAGVWLTRWVFAMEVTKGASMCCSSSWGGRYGHALKGLT